jgi:alkylation response protein AidB-like acyl-CoA dehydrogenase
MVRLQRDLGLRIVGPAGMLHAYRDEHKDDIHEATGNPFLPMVTGAALYAQAPPIYGGTDQIQRNIIGERALGLPKEPGDLSKLPFSQLPKNA